MIAFLKDLFQTLGTDWGAWLIVVLALWFFVTLAKWVLRIAGFLGDKVSR